MKPKPSAPESPAAAKAAIEAMLKAYPAKTHKKRAKQLVVNDPDQPIQISANMRSTPGIITQRGCCYAGCKGVVLGPISDILHIVHGPVGCSYYTWGTRRNLARAKAGSTNYVQYCMTTDMQEDQIIFGGEKKLRLAIREAYDIFKPKAIAVYSTCPVGLIGDDVHAVAREMKAEARNQHLRVQLRGLQGRQPVRRPPYRQQRRLQEHRRARRHAGRRRVSRSTSWASTTSAETAG